LELHTKYWRAECVTEGLKRSGERHKNSIHEGTTGLLYPKSLTLFLVELMLYQNKTIRYKEKKHKI
jgi:hypothetical protein